jgi:dienelactone hydrolase
MLNVFGFASVLVFSATSTSAQTAGCGLEFVPNATVVDGGASGYGYGYGYGDGDGDGDGDCPSTCWGQTCDYWAEEDNGGWTCLVNEQEYDCDCSGCACAADDTSRRLIGDDDSLIHFDDDGGTAGAGAIKWSVPFHFDGTYEMHTFTIPANYSSEVPTPLLIYFHGWGGDHKECGNLCRQASEHGFITAALSGIEQSWNGVGTTDSPGPAGSTCESTAPNYCEEDCNGCADNCWWTTCKDSVEQTIHVLEYLESVLCINVSMIWATGGSNGGVFNHALAADQRIAPRLAGIAPSIGLPHSGE